MNGKEKKYSQFALVREMIETVQAVRKLPQEKILDFADKINTNLVFLTGEGSSRIFPAKNTIYNSLRYGYRDLIFCEGATQALEYDLNKATVFVASNSGKTKEGVRLIRHLKTRSRSAIFAVVAKADTPIINEADAGYVLSCGPEEAVAATKSVIEQALFYDLIFRKRNARPLPDLNKLAELIEKALTQKIVDEIIEPLTAAQVLYFAGRNNGVAEELTLKTNEITRKKSDYLEGTYAVHGIEEVMKRDEAVILIDPFVEEEEKFQEVLVKGAELKVVAIASRPTIFPTIVIPFGNGFETYLQLVAGWNLLVEVGLRLGINLDKPERARKVGNEFIG